MDAIVFESPLTQLMKITFGSWLSLKRKAAQLTQQELADKLGIQKQSVSKWERDLSNPSLNPDQTAKLCLALDVDLFELQKAFLENFELR